MDWETYSFVVRAKQRKAVVLALKIERIPSQIARITKINTSHVSRALLDLKENGIIECVNIKQRSGRIYRLTKEGNDIRNHIEKSELL